MKKSGKLGLMALLVAALGSISSGDFIGDQQREKIPARRVDTLSYNSGREFRQVLFADEKTGIKQLKNLAFDRGVEYFLYLPNQKKWIEVGEESKVKIDFNENGFSYVCIGKIDFDQVKREFSSPINDRVVLYHTRPAQVINEDEFHLAIVKDAKFWGREKLEKVVEGYKALPKFIINEVDPLPKEEEIADFIRVAGNLYEFHPNGQIDAVLVSISGETRYGMTDRGRRGIVDSLGKRELEMAVERGIFHSCVMAIPRVFEIAGGRPIQTMTSYDFAEALSNRDMQFRFSANIEGYADRN